MRGDDAIHGQHFWTGVPAAIESLNVLSAAERLQVFANFCVHCGRDDPGCQCWNDE